MPKAALAALVAAVLAAADLVAIPVDADAAGATVPTAPDRAVTGAAGHDPAATPAPVIAAVAAGDQLRLHLGELPDGARQPRFTQVVIRTDDGAWSDASMLPQAREGTPFLHRGLTWFLETRTDRTGTLYDALIPVSGEPGTIAVRLERGQDLQGATVLGLDPWTFVVGEANGSQVLARVITSAGSSLEFEVTREASWDPGWPRATRLLATGVVGPDLVVVGAGADMVHVSAHDGTRAAAAPPLSVEGATPVAACVISAGPVVIAAREASLVAWSWSGAAWSEPATLAIPGSGRVAALTVTPFGREHRDAAAVALLAGDERIVVSAILHSGDWGRAERKVLGASVAPDAAIRPRSERPTLGEVERRATQLSRLRWGLVVITFPVLVLLLRHLSRLRR